MGDRRQVHRREPIEIELDNGSIFVARPLPWMKRNDFGAEILRQNTEAVNDAVRLFQDPETDLVQLEMKLTEKLSNPLAVLLMGYPDHKAEDFGELDYHELVELIIASLEVNYLEHLRHLVDPNSPTPMLNGGGTSSAEGEIAVGQKIESLVGSISSDSTENKSSDSPMEKSSPS